jgi:hypothetical protein
MVVIVVIAPRPRLVEVQQEDLMVVLEVLLRPEVVLLCNPTDLPYPEYKSGSISVLVFSQALFLYSNMSVR